MLAAAPRPAGAVLDINDRGPMLHAGRFNLRITNAGIVGNPFPERSFDPSFEYPKGSGTELMQYGALWVGAINDQGQPVVSGGPNLEWRPTPAPDDTVHEAWAGQPGTIRGFDDDGDGRIDEEILNGKDDDGDGEIDEDCGIAGQQTLACDYIDDRPEAAAWYYGGEPHRPLGLSVHQEAYAWSYPGYDGIAGLTFHITNHGNTPLHQLYIGFYADFDVRTKDSQGGTGDDNIGRVTYSQSIPRGTSSVYVDGSGLINTACFERFRGTALPAVVGREGNAFLPVVTILPLEHTHDPLAYIQPAVAWGPKKDSFNTYVFAANRGALAGGPPILDADRYAALAGQWPQSPDDFRGEQHVLVSAGPYPSLAPGQSIDFTIALVAAPSLDSLGTACARAAFLYSGIQLNLQPDYKGADANWWIYGETGINGHEDCVEAPAGYEFTVDPDCGLKFAGRPDPLSDPPSPHFKVYRHGQCIWTDADCDVCTGNNGNETTIRWVDPAKVPPPPAYRVTAFDRAVKVEWDNMPEIQIAAGVAGPVVNHVFVETFLGYKVYKLADWRNRSSLLPPEENWALLAAFGPDSSDSKRLLGTVTDSTVAYDRIWYERPHYPVGRYAVVDSQVFDGFDYIYMVTSVVQVQLSFAGVPIFHRYESPIIATFRQMVRPRRDALPDAHAVWVVPNPFRGHADWDLPAVHGDRLTRHLDFMGLPRAPCTIRIWTVAGDHVATIQHDGSGGSGEASWDLVSRNGEEVASGIYLFTVDSSLGKSTGRFVVIR